MISAKITRIFSFLRYHKGLSAMLVLFTFAHWWLWNNYYISMWGWIRYVDFFSWQHLGFAITGVAYWLLYSAVLYLAYAKGKKTFIATSIFYIFSILITVPFSLAKVDLSVKFALLLKSNFEWIYLKNYLSWIIWTFIAFVLVASLLGYFLYRTHRKGVSLKKRWRNTILAGLILVMGYHLVIHPKAIDTEFIPSPYYDNEMGRVVRVIEALFFYNFSLFPDVKLSGTFESYEMQNPRKKMGIHGVYAFLDTLQYEYLSIHGNPHVPKNRDLERYLKQGILVDLGPTLSCGSHTTASIPDMFSINDCQVGPFFHSEILTHLMQRVGVENHFVGQEGLSQFFHAVFQGHTKEDHMHYVSYEETAKALQITGQNLKSYPHTPSSLTTVYYDAVHPGFKCSFIVAGGLPESSCQGYEAFSTATPEYPLGMAKAVQVIEADLARFIQISEDNPRPIFMILTSDHGLSKNFVHGDMADAEVSPDKIHEAVQRHTNFLIYGNRAYRHWRSEEWSHLQSNAAKWQGYLNHRALVPSVLGGLGISWSEKEKISPYNVFSLQLRPIIRNKVIPNDYLRRVSMPKPRIVEEP